MVAIRAESGLFYETSVGDMPVFGLAGLSEDPDGKLPRTAEEAALINETLARTAGELVTHDALTDPDS